MAQAVRLAAYAPPARDDEAWTTAGLIESPARAGVETEIETYPLSTGVGNHGGKVSPAGLDSDPLSPVQRSLTTEVATLAAGWYLIEWRDASGDTARTGWVFNGANIAPGLRDVALLLPTRMRDDAGALDTFTTETKPSRADVEGYIGKGIRRVRLKVGSVPEALAGDARDLVALYAAAAAERARWPEQQGDNEGPANALLEDFKEQLADLDAAILEVGAGGEVGPVDDTPAPIGVFPLPAVRWDTEAL